MKNERQEINYIQEDNMLLPEQPRISIAPDKPLISHSDKASKQN